MPKRIYLFWGRGKKKNPSYYLSAEQVITEKAFVVSF